jgi:hypothetical protein
MEIQAYMGIKIDALEMGGRLWTGFKSLRIGSNKGLL